MLELGSLRLETQVDTTLPGSRMSVNEEATGLQKMLELGSLRLETQVDTTLPGSRMSVNEEITGLQKMLELGSLRLETQVDTTLPGSRMLQPAWQEGSQNEGNGTNRANGHRVSVAKYTLLFSLVLTG
jgi:hypothetical protein